MIATMMTARNGKTSASSTTAWPRSLRICDPVALISVQTSSCNAEAGGSRGSVNPPASPVRGAVDALQSGDGVGDVAGQPRGDDEDDRSCHRDHGDDQHCVLRRALTLLAVADARDRIQQADLCECEKACQFDSPPPRERGYLAAGDVRRRLASMNHPKG